MLIFAFCRMCFQKRKMVQPSVMKELFAAAQAQGLQGLVLRVAYAALQRARRVAAVRHGSARE